MHHSRFTSTCTLTGCPAPILGPLTHPIDPLLASWFCVRFASERTHDLGETQTLVPQQLTPGTQAVIHGLAPAAGAEPLTLLTPACPTHFQDTYHYQVAGAQPPTHPSEWHSDPTGFSS